MAANPSANLGFQNFFSATLTSDITASSTDIPMDAIPNATEGFLVIEPDSTTAREVIFYDSKTALKVVCPSAGDGRGQDDTTAGSHSTGATVIMAPVAGFWEAFQSGRAFTNNVINTSKLKTASEFIYDHVASGMVITGDSLGVNKNYSISSGVVYIAGERCTVAAVSAQTVGASKDRYVDLRSNGDGTASYITNEVNNNAASQALVAGDLRVGIVVAGATFITNAGSINQGEETKVLPIASSIPYAVTDSLGNLICPRDPNRRTLGYRQIVTNFATASTSAVQVTGVSCPVIVPAGRKVKVTAMFPSLSASTGTNWNAQLWDGTVGSGTQLNLITGKLNDSTFSTAGFLEQLATPSATSKTYNLGLTTNPGTITAGAAATNPIWIKVELI